MEPPPPPITPASPFNPGQPRQPGRSGGSPRKPLLIGCGVALVLLGVAAVLLIVKLPQLMDWLFTRMETQILAKLPPDVTPEERQRLTEAFDAAAEALGTGKADQAKAQQLNAVLMDFARQGRPITREDVLKLTRALEETAGKKGMPP